MGLFSRKPKTPEAEPLTMGYKESTQTGADPERLARLNAAADEAGVITATAAQVVSSGLEADRQSGLNIHVEDQTPVEEPVEVHVDRAA
jgi:hypothetical protein